MRSLAVLQLVVSTVKFTMELQAESLVEAIDPTTITPFHRKYPKIIHYAGLPAEALVGSINGLLSGVLAYAGAQLFVEFMAEMRRPRDFLKVSMNPPPASILTPLTSSSFLIQAMWGAQLFIYTVYVVYGCYVYYVSQMT